MQTLLRIHFSLKIMKTSPIKSTPAPAARIIIMLLLSSINSVSGAFSGFTSTASIGLGSIIAVFSGICISYTSSLFA